MRRPFSDKRPVGPFAQLTPSKDSAEVNVFFKEDNIPRGYVDVVQSVVDDSVTFAGDATGPHGTSSNVVSLQTTGNSVTLSQLEELESEIEKEITKQLDVNLSERVRNIELIF